MTIKNVASLVFLLAVFTVAAFLLEGAGAFHFLENV